VAGWKQANAVLMESPSTLGIKTKERHKGAILSIPLSRRAGLQKAKVRDSKEHKENLLSASEF